MKSDDDCFLAESNDKPRQCVEQQRHHSADKVPYKIMVFPMVTYGCESWIVKKAEHQRIDTFDLWCWRRLLRVPWTARRSKQSILKKINPEHSLEGLMLKLNLQYFGHLMWIANSLEKSLMLGKTEGRMRRGQQKMRWLDSWMASLIQWTKTWANFQEVVRDRKAWHIAIHGVTKIQTRLSNWTTTIFVLKKGSQLRPQKGRGQIVFPPLHTPGRIMAGP